MHLWSYKCPFKDTELLLMRISLAQIKPMPKLSGVRNLFLPGPFGYLWHHSQAIQNYQLIHLAKQFIHSLLMSWQGQENDFEDRVFPPQEQLSQWRKSGEEVWTTAASAARAAPTQTTACPKQNTSALCMLRTACCSVIWSLHGRAPEPGNESRHLEEWAVRCCYSLFSLSLWVPCPLPSLPPFH